MGTILQHLLPKKLLSRLVGNITACRVAGIKNFFIKNYCRHYKIDLNHASETNYTNYGSFRDFFTRALKPEARPINGDDRAIISPVDGIIQQIGDLVDEDKIITAKGRGLRVGQLLGNYHEGEKFLRGTFIVLYLSPADYHRVHMPTNGQLTLMRYISGKLFSVSPKIINKIPNIFTRNERVVINFDCRFGRMGLILVGALLVGSIETIWAGRVNSDQGKMVDWNYVDQKITLKIGEEIGRFNLGSTVILLFPKETIRLNSESKEGKRVRMGEKLGEILN